MLLHVSEIHFVEDVKQLLLTLTDSFSRLSARQMLYICSHAQEILPLNIIFWILSFLFYFDSSGDVIVWNVEHWKGLLNVFKKYLFLICLSE